MGLCLEWWHCYIKRCLGGVWLGSDCCQRLLTSCSPVVLYLHTSQTLEAQVASQAERIAALEAALAEAQVSSELMGG
jgi:hypothetical protein